MSLPQVSYPQGEKAVLMGRATLGTEYMKTRGYTDTDTHDASFKTARAGKEKSAIIRALIDLYIANPNIVSEVA